MSSGSAAACLAALVMAVSLPTRAAEAALATGDLVFQTSRSAQSLPIQRATGSPWSHVGIVEVDAQGPWVIEAIGRVSRTPWRAWRARGEGGRVLVLRPAVVPEAARARAVAEARRHLGKPYDARFGWGDDRMYCSELVHKAYARGAGVALGRTERIEQLRLDGLEPAVRDRFGEVPRGLVLVTPASLAADPRLVPVVPVQDRELVTGVRSPKHGPSR
jgi:hypothetical protein